MAATGGRQITERDCEIVAWIGRHGIVTSAQVTRKFFVNPKTDAPSERRAYQRLKILREDLGLIQRDRLAYHRTPEVLRITTAGARVGKVDVRPARLIKGDLSHSVAVVDLVEYLLKENPSATLRTEREMRKERAQDRKDDNRLAGRGRCPDGELTLAPDTTVAIELDLTPKSTAVIERIIHDYRYEDFDAVWWYALPHLVPRLRRIVTDNHASEFVDVRIWPSAPMDE